MSLPVHLGPLFALVAVTVLVWLAMLAQRARRMMRDGISPEDMPTRTAADAKFGDAQAPNNALMNLFELPVLFYVLWLLLMHTKQHDYFYLLLGWLYVALRAVQALVHVTYNRVAHRGAAYLISCVVLWVLWLRFALQLYVGLG